MWHNFQFVSSQNNVENETSCLPRINSPPPLEPAQEKDSFETNRENYVKNKTGGSIKGRKQNN